MNFEKRARRGFFWEGLEGRKGKVNDVTIWKIKNSFKTISRTSFKNLLIVNFVTVCR